MSDPKELEAITDEAMLDLYQSPPFISGLKAIGAPPVLGGQDIVNLLIKQAFSYGFKAGAVYVAEGIRGKPQ